MATRVLAFGVAWLLGGCPQPVKFHETGLVADTDSDSDSDSDSDADADADPEESGLVATFLTGDFSSDGDSAFGHFGVSLYAVRSEVFVCVGEGEISSTGPAVEGCPDCAWSFAMTPVTNITAVGDECDYLGWTDGFLDGRFEYTWGFAEAYYYDHAGTPLLLTDTIFIYDSAWYAFAFTWADYGIYHTYGDASYVEFTRETPHTYGYYFYYR